MTIVSQFMEYELGELKPEGELFRVIPVPWEHTVSYGRGTGDGPAAILEASDQLEIWDGFSIPAQEGIGTAGVVDCTGAPEEVLLRIQTAVDEAARAGSIPVVLGGEHTVTLGALRAMQHVHGEIGVVQFDAHADLRDEYEETAYSHACVMRRALELGLPLWQIGVRSLSPAEVSLRAERRIPFLDGPELPLVPTALPSIPDSLPEKVYVTFDVDGLDASLMPATGTPEPGGLFWHQAMWLLSLVAGGRTIVGFDVVELAPIAGMHAPDFTAARLVYNIMGMIQRNR